jgi:pimeloyl-ACP methyl ester carboxylesterase
MALAAQEHRCVAVDLPGIGGSSASKARGDKFWLARTVHELLHQLGLSGVTLVGHDIGGMVAFAYLKQFCDLGQAVIMDTVLPGLPPSERVIANPCIWHFAFHNVPQLPEQLVTGNVKAYFDYFYEAIAARKDAITQQARRRYVASYSLPGALTQGFEFYRAFRRDALDNTLDRQAILTPTLYLRGSKESGDIADYRDGLAAAGVRNLTAELVEGAGHFAPEEAPECVWAAIAAHLRAMPADSPKRR